MKNTHRHINIQNISLMREKRLLQEVGSVGSGREGQESVEHNDAKERLEKLKNVIGVKDVIEARTGKFENTLDSIFESAPKFFSNIDQEKSRQHFVENSQNPIDIATALENAGYKDVFVEPQD